jgi:hypothetical protein
MTAAGTLPGRVEGAGKGRIVGAVVFLVALLVAGAVAVVWLGTRDPVEAGPGGFLALKRFLGSMGAEVSSEDGPPEHGVFVLLSDFRGREEAASVLSWVEGGGRLVLADPHSATAEVLSVAAGGLIGPAREESLQPGCVAPEIVGVGEVTVDSSDVGLELPPEAVGCFPGRGGPFLGIVPHGKGSVVVLGGASPLTNEMLLRSDNGLLALRSFAPAAGCRPAGTVCGPVVFGPAIPAGFGEGKGLWASMPPRAKAVAAGLTLALVLFAAARGRRLGKPVLEDPVTVIPASQLAHAASGLYRNARAAQHAGTLLRDAAAWRISRRLGFPTADPGEVRRLLEADGRLGDAAGILDAPAPRDDIELIELGGRLAELEAAAVKELQ